MTLKHTDFMYAISKRIKAALPDDYATLLRLGERRWFAQVYFWEERRIHYEVSRPYSRSARHIEIGLHFETRNADYNRQLLTGIDRHLVEIQDTLGRDVKAEVWDKGWTKVYELFPDEDPSDALVDQCVERWAAFIIALQPIYSTLNEKR